MPSILLVRYVLTAALRDRFLQTFAALLVVATSLSLFLSSAAVIEQAQFALVFTAGALRLLACLALVLFVVFFIRRSFEMKDVDFLLSRPVSRLSYILSHALAFSGLALVFSLLCGLVLAGVAGFHFPVAFCLWMLSVAMEAVIMVNVALFFSMVLSSPVMAALASLGLYVLGRMMGQILGIIDAHDAAKASFLDIPMQIVSLVMPRLDLLGQTSWLVYGLEQGGAGLVYILGQGAVFIVLILAASLFDLVRRQF